MKRKFRIGTPNQPLTTDWRAYQNILKSDAKRRRFKRRLPFWGRLFLIIAIIVGAGYTTFAIVLPPGSLFARHNPKQDKQATATPDADPSINVDKNKLRAMLSAIEPDKWQQKDFSLFQDGKKYTLTTSIDQHFQQTMVDQLRLEHARYLSIIALNPDTGRILTMISHDRQQPNNNTCVSNRFPAASIFKIVTASAAIEALDLNAHSPMIYNGRKHTLYKSQLKEKKNKWTRRVPLKEAFALSINPVFGKLGANRLGKKTLLSYAQAFGFNHQFNLDLPVAPSQFVISDKPYQWAEMASGFNQDTTLSPLHGAIIAAAISNGGRLIAPTLIDKVVDDKGRIIYRSQPSTVKNAIDRRTADMIAKMMVETVKKGTARKVFRGHTKDRILSKVEIGGKTGSINNDPRYDWYVGFATDKADGHSLVISVMVAHEKFIGIKSGQYARMAIKAYFDDYFAKQALPPISTTTDNLSNG